VHFNRPARERQKRSLGDGRPRFRDWTQPLTKAKFGSLVRDFQRLLRVLPLQRASKKKKKSERIRQRVP
jgi:hypothetical protein